MIWALDMDDFSGKFCRKKRKGALKRFPLVMAMKEEFESEQLTSPISTVPSTTTSLSNETILSSDEFKAVLDQMFQEASSSLRRRCCCCSSLLSTLFLLACAQWQRFYF